MECGTFFIQKTSYKPHLWSKTLWRYSKTFGKMCAPTSLSMCRQGECSSSKKIAQRSSSFSNWLSFEYWVKRAISFWIHFLNSSLAYSLLTTRPPNLSLVECRTRSFYSRSRPLNSTDRRVPFGQIVSATHLATSCALYRASAILGRDSVVTGGHRYRSSRHIYAQRDHGKGGEA